MDLFKRIKNRLRAHSYNMYESAQSGIQSGSGSGQCGGGQSGGGQSGGGGQVCFDSNNFLFFVGLLCIVSFALIYLVRNKTFEQKNTSPKPPTPINVQIIKKIPEHIPIVRQNPFGSVVEHIPFPRELNNPYIPPTRYYDDLNLNLPFNIPTRGYDDGMFQKVGFVKSKKHRLPLFGKRQYPGSDRWEYYIEDDSRHRNKIDITLQGNKEIFDKDQVSVPGYKKLFVAHIYEYSQLRYYPNIL